MKIKDVRTIALAYTCEPPYASASGVQARRGALLVEVETDDGTIGIGEAGPGGGVTATCIEKDLKPLLLGEDPLMIEGLWQKMFVRTRQYGRRGIVMNAIGGIAAEAEDYRARGFKGMKMKIGRNPSTGTHLRQVTGQAEFCEVDPSEDLARIAAARQALGPRVKLMVDVNCAWSPAFAIEMGREMAPYKLFWIEEPVMTDDIDGSARVAAALDTAIAGYETELSLAGFRELITRGAVDIVQPDIAWTGGFSEGKRIAAFAQAHHRMVAPHSFGSAVLLMASLHYAASIPNGLVLEWDQNPNGLRTDLLKHDWRLESDSTIKLPDRPGLGVELDRAALDRFRVG